MRNATPPRRVDDARLARATHLASALRNRAMRIPSADVGRDISRSAVGRPRAASRNERAIRTTTASFHFTGDGSEDSPWARRFGVFEI
jgi:hypothetical protein